MARLAARQYGVVSRRQLLRLGLSQRAIELRLRAGRLHRLHYGVYAVGHELVPIRGRWLAAVMTFGPGTVLSHRSAAALWGLAGSRRGPAEVTVGRVRPRPGVRIHRGRLARADRAEVDRIPVTTVARTLLDLADVEDEERVSGAFEEADRPDPGRSPLEQLFAALCREQRLPPPMTNVSLLGHEVDAYWPGARLVVEVDGFSFHGHRAAFERDRARDAAMQAEGYHVVRVTHRRLRREPAALAAQLRRLLNAGVEERARA